MSSEEREVILDDTDPLISWEGPWFLTQYIVEDLAGFGPPFLGTLHGINTNGSLKFSFHGSKLSVWGTLKPRKGTSASSPDPYWQCIVDGQNIGIALEYPTRSYNNYPLCWAENLVDGYHTLQLDTIIKKEPLWVDQILYVAPPSIDLFNNWTGVPHSSSKMSYSSGWQGDENGYRKWTYTTGASLTYSFTGEAVVWGGYTPDDPNASPGLASYTVDGKQPPVTFTIPSRPGNWTNQPYFSITNLKPGPHQLQVVNQGSISTAPLGLSYIYTKNSPTGSSSGTSGKIIGGAVGGAVGAILLAGILAFILIRRRRRRSEQPVVDYVSYGSSVAHGSITPNTTGQNMSSYGSPNQSVSAWPKASSPPSYPGGYYPPTQAHQPQPPSQAPPPAQPLFVPPGHQYAQPQPQIQLSPPQVWSNQLQATSATAQTPRTMDGKEGDADYNPYR